MSDPFISQIQPVAFNFAHRGWALCHGALLPIASNTALFSLIGTIYGGDGRTTTQLPDLRGRTMINYGRGPGLTDRRIGSRGGVETVTLTTQTIPAHNHTGSVNPMASSSQGTSSAPAVGTNTLSGFSGGNLYGNTAPDVDLNMANGVGNTGGGQSHNNMPPFLAMNICICLQGTYPSRS